MTCCYVIPASPFGSHHHGMSHHGWRGGHCCCCCGPGYGRFPRRFLSPEEEKKELEKYRDELQKELAGVEEMLKKIGG